MDRSQYTVGWICAVTEQFAAAQAFFDEKYERPQDLDLNDSNTYALGKISNHNVAIACLPLGEYGKASAADVAVNLLRSFPNIRIGLMVGIGGGAPTKKHDIRLGDIVVSTPGNANGGVFQYDFGKTIQERDFIETGFLNQPPVVLRTALQALKTSYRLDGHTLVDEVNKVLQGKPRLRSNFCRPKIDDRLYKSTFVHSIASDDCQPCGGDSSNIVLRRPRGQDEDDPAIHYGLIASGDQLMKDAKIRDKLAKERGILCFEMEAAGLMNGFPCLVIRGICDYSDTHKNDEWQGYAAMMAAAFAKDLLRQLVHAQVVAGKSANELLLRIHNQLESLSQNTNRVSYKLDLAKLPLAHGAEMDSYATQHDDECLPGTRVEILRRVTEWATSLQEKCIFWLAGMAGTGKSTISRTLAKNFEKEKVLGATFFFKRGEADRGNAARFFTTIARQLQRRIPEIDLRKIIEEEPDISNKSLAVQFEKLILQPLSDLHSTNGETPLIVIVIDALDECEGDNDIRAIIQLLPQIQASGFIRIRVFITSRPELPVRLGFEDIEGDYQDLVLHHIPRADVEHDISLFIEHKLEGIRKYRSLTEDWPGEAKTRMLVTLSVPLFIFAATVCRMFQDYDLDPEQSLEDTFKYEAEESKLDAVYLPILNRLYSKYGENQRQKHFEQVREVVSVIVLLENPLSIPSLSKLIDIPTTTIKSRLNSLHSVLNIPIDEAAPVRLLHLSFRDFLLDHGTRKKTALWIDEKETHRRLTIQCIEQMRKGLEENICHLPDYDTEPGEISLDTIAQCIPPELQYSCRYWVYHLERSQNSAALINNALLFLQEHLLHWIEAMSWLGFISDVISALKSLQSVAEDGRHSDMMELLDDARRFILKFSYIVGTAPRQLYISGLVFAPTGSIIEKLFFEKKPDWISALGSIENSWGAQLQSFEGHTEMIRSIAFSPNGLLLASGAKDHTVKIWDLTTGALRQTFTGYSKPIKCVAFSLDSQVLISVSQDVIIRLWDVTTGVLQRTIKHDFNLYSYVAAISPDGRWVAAPDSRGFIAMWDLALGIEKYQFGKTSDQTSPLAFSANGLLLAGGSDADIIIWDIITGTLRQTLKGHSEQKTVESIAFSPDGQLLASSHTGSIVTLWDVVNGTQKYRFGERLSVNSVAFSPDSQLLAIGHAEGTIIWSIPTYHVHRKNSNPASIITFSSDGKTLASAYRGTVIELWDLTVEVSKPDSQLQSINNIEFFSDGQMVISTRDSGTYSRGIDVWNPIQGTRLKSFKDYNPGSLHWHSKDVMAVSPDGRLLAYPSKYGRSVMIRDIATGNHWSIRMNGGMKNKCESMNFSPDSQQLVIVNRVGISFWIHTGDGSGCWVSQRTLQHKKNKVNSISFSPDGRLLAVCFPTILKYEGMSYGYAIDIWDCTTGLLVQTLETCRRALTSVAFSTNGQLLARERWGGDWDGSTCLVYSPIIEPWDLSTGKLHPDLIVEGRYKDTDGVGNSLPPINDLEFHDLQNRYVKAKDNILFQGQWVCFQGRKILWLPPRYRPTCYAANDNILALGHEWGGVTFVKFSFPT